MATVVRGNVLRVRQWSPPLPLAREERWARLFLATRWLGLVTAVGLLAVQQYTQHDGLLVAAGLAYGTLSSVAVLRRPDLTRRPWFWIIDATAVLALVLASGDWRSPFYLLALTTLALPAAALPFRRALLFGTGFTLAYLLVALATGVDLIELRDMSRLESLATHLMLPLIVTLAVAYAAQVLRRLEGERRRSERLALESERRRIAWELHDSAKQRLHAAQLVLGVVRDRVDDGAAGALGQVADELDAAVGDMETSIAELRSPLEDRPLDVALRERAAELSALGGTTVEVTGGAPWLPSFVAAHAYRILAEAMTNAVRHAHATHVAVALTTQDGHMRVRVCDNGAGMPDTVRPGANGLRVMRSRAVATGAELTIGAGPAGRGTAVSLEIPLSPRGAPS